MQIHKEIIKGYSYSGSILLLFLFTLSPMTKPLCCGLGMQNVGKEVITMLLFIMDKWLNTYGPVCIELLGLLISTFL